MEDINKLIAELEARAIEVIKENTELKKELQALKKELENKSKIIEALRCIS